MSVADRSWTCRLLTGIFCAALVGAITGCAPSPLVKRTALFAPAALAASRDTAAAYQMAEASNYQAHLATAVNEYDTQGFHPEKIKPFLSPEVVAVHAEVLAGLKRYAEKLAEVSSDKPLKDVDAEATALSTSLQSLSKSSELQGLMPAGNSEVSIDVASAAIDALGKALIEHKRRKELPHILKAMRDPINNLCTLLGKDIGAPGESGLRDKLWNDYDTMITDQQVYLRTNKASMSPSEKRAEIERLPQMVLNQRSADLVLKHTQAELAALAKTHTALAESGGDRESATFKVMFSQLADESRQFETFYQKVSAK